MVGTIDLNGATAPTNVPVNPTITATFSTDVDVATATTSNVTLTESYDALSIPLTVTASGKVVTITPIASLANGALYTLAVTAGFKSIRWAGTHTNQPFIYNAGFISPGRYGGLLEF